MIDGYYPNMNKYIISNTHRFKNIEILSIDIKSLSQSQVFNVFGKIKHLTFNDNFSTTCRPNEVQLLPFLETISFVNTWQLIPILSFLQNYRINNEQNTNNVSNYYNSIIHQIQSIAFVDCYFYNLDEDDIYPDEHIETYKNYKNMLHFILPSQPNKLEILKFEHSYFIKTDNNDYCNDSNNEFENIIRIKLSLTNLKGFVYGESPHDNNSNLFFNLANTFLSNLSLFTKLESLHTHSSNLLLLYLNNNNTNIFNNISELCISISMNQNNTSPTHNINRLFPNLEKLCLVININDNDRQYISNFQKIIESILKNNIKLKIFQIVAVIAGEENDDDNFCISKLNILGELNGKLVELIRNLRSYWGHSRIKKQPLVFKYHIKLSHSYYETKCKVNYSDKLTAFINGIQDIILQYLITYPCGKIQSKVSWNSDQHFRIGTRMFHSMKGLNEFIQIDVKLAGYLQHVKDCKIYCCNEMDFKQCAISATNKNIIEKEIEHNKKWKVDCRYCCNTPWV